MKVPFRLRRVDPALESDALLVPGDDARAVLLVVAEVSRPGERELPRIHRVAGGFLVRWARPTREAFPGALRLRALSPAVYVPIDAALEPALLEDEARGLARDRGLVFLPGDRILAFDPARALAPADLLDAGKPARDAAWQPFEGPEPLSAGIQKILVHEPPGAAERALEKGGEGIGEQPPAPPTTPDAAASGAGRVTLGAGKLLSGLGKLLGSQGLAGAGADLIKKALAKAPGLAENVLGRQEAALRELLRKFRAGEIDEALRRALPLGGPGSGGVGIAGGSELPTHDTRYSLGNVLDRGGKGPAGVWIGGADDVQKQLASEYRKAAERARKQGDARRAAFIYAKLLRDYRAAAEALLSGGLAHDAAILYLETGDTLAAARAFEAAGELDRAVELYRKRGEHVTAGDVLRRLGDEAAAVAEYQLAAARLADMGHHVRASALLLEKAKRRDLAIKVLEEGWAARPRPEAVSCALHLPGLYVLEETPAKVLALVAEADEVFEKGGYDVAAVQLWNGLAKLAGARGLETVRDEVLDRSRLGLARKLRERGERERRAGDLAAQVFVPGTWSPAVVTDAAFALADSRKRRADVPLAPPAASRIAVGAGVVTAVAWARRTGEVFLGFERGEVMAFRPVECDIGRVCTPLAPVTGLACTDDGEHLVILRAPSEDTLAPTLESCVRAPFAAYRLEEKRALDVAPTPRLSIRGPAEVQSEPWIAPVIARNPGAQSILLLHDGQALRVLEGSRLVPTGPLGSDFAWHEVTGLVFLPDESGSEHLLLALDDGGCTPWIVSGRPEKDEPQARRRLNWSAATPGSLESPLFASLRPSGRSHELAAVTAHGSIVWRSERHDEDGLHVETRSSSCKEGYLAVALMGPGLLAGVTATAVSWLRASGDELVLRATSEIKIGRAIAAFPSERTHELIVVTSDGYVVRVAIPS